ncbi:MAG TPA: sugar transferase [Leadbetterella sp.]|nr:sugar transferase [Leadbetterella sp.]
MKKKILIIDDNQMVLGLLNFKLKDSYELRLAPTLQTARMLINESNIPDLLIIDLNLGEESGLSFIKEIKANRLYSQIPILVLSGEEKSEVRIECLELGADDYVVKPFHPEELKLRIEKILSIKRTSATEPLQPEDVLVKLPKPQMSFRKRAFDVVLSFLAIVLLFPVLFLVAIMIKIDSKGPFLYLSKRVGAGYKVFDLYKFRTMKINADKDISAMNAANMYNKTTEVIEEKGMNAELIYDGGWTSEQALKNKKENTAAFMKFQNDPRITRLGTFLRNTSLDELPQLFNILKGDMSIVGNRPLPLYEAEKLTKDESAARFLAPAGLTGLWQVTKRGKTGVSEKERMELDNTYAHQHNWLFDIKLILKTFPAVFQSEKM